MLMVARLSLILRRRKRGFMRSVGMRRLVRRCIISLILKLRNGEFETFCRVQMELWFILIDRMIETK
jgi:hypothetical protein